jgi:hypothetical protein
MSNESEIKVIKNIERIYILILGRKERDERIKISLMMNLLE